MCSRMRLVLGVCWGCGGGVCEWFLCPLDASCYEVPGFREACWIGGVVVIGVPRSCCCGMVFSVAIGSGYAGSGTRVSEAVEV